MIYIILHCMLLMQCLTLYNTYNAYDILIYIVCDVHVKSRKFPGPPNFACPVTVGMCDKDMCLWTFSVYQYIYIYDIEYELFCRNRRFTMILF